MTRAALTFVVVVALVLLALALTPPNNDAPRYPYLPTPVSAPTCAPALAGMEPA